MSEGQKPAPLTTSTAKSVTARLYAVSKAAEYDLSQDEFQQTLDTIAAKYCPEGSPEERVTLIESLRHEELARRKVSLHPMAGQQGRNGWLVCIHSLAQ